MRSAEKSFVLNGLPMRARAQTMTRVQANILAVLVSALSVASIFLTHTLFAVVRNVQFETGVMKKEYSQPVFRPPPPGN